MPVVPPLHSVPFPSVSIRDGSPGGERPASRADLVHTRTQSDTSMGSKNFLSSANVDEDGSPFSIRPPSPDRASRFDPKVNHGRTASNATMGTMASKNILAEDNPFAVRPPSPSRLSRFDPKVRARTMSVGSMGTRILIDNDTEADSRRDRPYSTVELLRPKVLVMPSPLQNVAPPPPPPPSFTPRIGFETSTDGPPLPPGARSANRSLTSLTNYTTPASAPIASNSFTPNPRASLTLSQLAFRNTLVVGGQRDIAYSDIDRRLPRAMKDGEQAKFEELEEEEEESPVPVSIPLPPAPPPTDVEMKRPAGKLYGRSLIDNLEHRKAEIKQKARVFTGDERPSMMVRGQIRRSSTLIDPQTLGRPPSQNLDNAITPNPRQSLLRRNSSGSKPLLDMQGEKPPMNLGPGAEQLLSKSRSVFGVDTLWDLEMVKLKKMEAEEKAEAEAQKKRQEEEEEHRSKKKKKGKSKGKGSAIPLESTSTDLPSGPRVGSAPPTLPTIQKPILKRAPQVDDESETESDDGYAVPKATLEKAADRWVSESSDEENEPRRITGVGPRYSSNTNPSRQFPQLNDDDSEEDLPLTAAAQRAVRRASKLGPLGIDDDSEEDIPLTAAAARIAKRATQLLHHADDDDDDEDKPLVDVINKARSINFDGQSRADEDEDERPLGLRASRYPLASQTSLPFIGGEEDDDKPLAFHPEQQRRTQYQMFAQAQQQQQMMMQAQMQNSMFFNPTMMGSGIFTPMAVPPMMMGVPMPPPSPPQAHDAGKYGRVDRWRRDVAVEGE
ncbi:uncharacterized protein EDB93DRAFT_1241646 [Suillus bovinus]|uniref:uncharacterized protein n=1 Tax=Suillus bovinus TaxID=48563 RepID=UPI001B862E35|nr:uncharacterized protein EDB93DRAFT_1241646 [Suillus bovinus]KAG2141688.1 hypothetical protein EDB93DRAFT_1241646 [Suillus bovinus]